MFDIGRDAAPTEGEEFLLEPLLHNPHLGAQALESPVVRSLLISAKVTRVWDLLDHQRSAWLTPESLVARATRGTLRTARRAIRECKAALHPDSVGYLEGVLRTGEPSSLPTPGSPVLLIKPKDRAPPQPPLENHLSRISQFSSTPLRSVSRRTLYAMALHNLHFLALVSRRDTAWREPLQPPEGESPQWEALYSPLVPRDAGDLGWRVLHGVLALGEVLRHFTDSDPACPFCGESESVFHIYFLCARLQPFFLFLKNLLLQFWLHFSPTLFIFGHPVRGSTKKRDLLVNLLLALGKLTIYKTRKRKITGEGLFDCGAMFRALLRSRVALEHADVESTGDMTAFVGQWALGGVLCTTPPFVLNI